MTTHDTESAPTAAGETEILETHVVETPLAWSRSDDSATEPVTYRRRSWKLPVIAASAALGAVLVAHGIHHAQWEHAQSTKPAPITHVAPPPAPKPLTQDEQFLKLVQQRGVRIVAPVLALNAARAVCVDESHGYTDPEIAQALVDSTPGTDLKTEAIFVDTAHEVYCLQH